MMYWPRLLDKFHSALLRHDTTFSQDIDMSRVTEVVSQPLTFLDINISKFKISKPSTKIYNLTQRYSSLLR